MPTNILYNTATWIKHRVLRVPIRMRARFDNHVKNPKLTVIFLHGISADSNTWRGTFNLFKKNPDFKNIRFVAYDLLGFGRSLRADWLKYTYDEYNEALDQSIKKSKITSPVMVIGHSMGSLIAANYVTEHLPIRDVIRLTLVSPPVLMAAELASLPDQVYQKTYSSLNKFAKEVPAAEVIAHLVQRFSSFRNYLKTTAFKRSMENIILYRHNYQIFTELRLPTLLLHGHFDPLVIGANLKRVAKNTPKYVRYQSVIGHHDISVGKRAKIVLEIKRALKDAEQFNAKAI